MANILKCLKGNSYHKHIQKVNVKLERNISNVCGKGCYYKYISFPLSQKKDKCPIKNLIRNMNMKL